MRTTHLTVVSLSDFNGARALQGQEPVTLEAGTCALANNMEIVEPLARAVLDAAPTVTIAGKEYALAGPLYDTQLEDNAMAATAMIIVVPDEAVEALKAAGCIPDLQYLNVMYADNGKTAGENDAALADIVAALQPRDMGGFEKGTSGADDPYASLLWPVTRILTANEMLTQSAGLRLMITYLALYIGFIFLVSTAAILAIQQLSQTSDSAPRYRTLWKLGCDRAMINRLAAVPGARVLPRAAGVGGVPLGLRYRRLVRFHAGRYRRVLGRPYHHGCSAHARHLRRLHAGDLPRRPRHREELAPARVAPVSFRSIPHFFVP